MAHGGERQNCKGRILVRVLLKKTESIEYIYLMVLGIVCIPYSVSIYPCLSVYLSTYLPM